MKILLIGPQGSGKSTQGKLLAGYLKIPYISTGDIFRQKALQDSDEGKRIKQILDTGQLVDDLTTRSLVEERLQRPDVVNGYILDGYPRTPEQADLFDVGEFKPEVVLYLKIPDEVAIERLIKRGRADDTPESIKTRLQLYKQNSEILLQSFKALAPVVEVDARGSVEQVQQRLREALNG